MASVSRSATAPSSRRREDHRARPSAEQAGWSVMARWSAQAWGSAEPWAAAGGRGAQPSEAAEVGAVPPARRLEGEGAVAVALSAPQVEAAAAHAGVVAGEPRAAEEAAAGEPVSEPA